MITKARASYKICVDGRMQIAHQEMRDTQQKQRIVATFQVAYRQLAWEEKVNEKNKRVKNSMALHHSDSPFVVG